jgi:hypothetical protein
MPADFPQRIPIVPTLRERRNGEQPLLAKRGSHVQLMSAWVHDVDIGIVSAFGVSFDKEKLHVFGYRYRHVGQTPPALASHLAVEVAAKVIPLSSGGGEPPDDVHWPRRANVLLPPDRVVRRQRAVHMHGFRCQRTNVEGQHSRAIYRVGRALSSQRANETYEARINSVSAKKNRASRLALSSLSDA